MVDSFMSFGVEGLPAQPHLQKPKKKAKSGKIGSDSLKRKKKHQVSIRCGEDDEAESSRASHNSCRGTKQS